MTGTGARPASRAAAPGRPAAVARAGGRASWPAWAALLTSVAGLATSIYLTVEHYTGSTTLSCPETGVVNCQKVTTSAESVILGVPVALLGVVFFAVMFAANLPVMWRSTATWVRTGRLVIAAGGALFVLYLLYAELFVVGAICLWCTAAHVLAIILFAIVAAGTALTAPDGTAARTG